MTRLTQPGDQSSSAPGLELLRSLASYPQRSVHLGRQRVRSWIVLIERDHNGNVVRSTERLELSEHTDLTGDFLD